MRLLVRIEAVIVALVLARDVIRQLVKREALAAHFMLVDRRAEAGEDRVPVVPIVVDRHVPLRDRHLARHGNDETVRENEIGHADVRVGAADATQRDHAHPVICRLDLNLRAGKLAHDPRHRHLGIDRLVAKQLAVALRGLLVMEEAMQEGCVGWVDAHLERLQPVAVDHALECEGVGRRRREAVELGKGRRLARSHIGEQDPALFHHRVGFLPDVGAHAAAFRLRRRLQTLARHIEQPAVERAAQAAVLEPPIDEVGAAVRTGALEQAVTADLVAKQDERFAEQANGLDRAVARQFVDQRGGLPIAAHQLARGGARPGAGEEIVLLSAQHARLRSMRSELKLTGSRAVCASGRTFAAGRSAEPARPPRR